MNKKAFGIRFDGLEQPLEEILKEHIKDKKSYMFYEIGVASMQTHRAISNIISENIGEGAFLTFGLDIKESADVNINNINGLFSNSELLINDNDNDFDVPVNRKLSENYKSVLILRSNPRLFTQSLPNDIFDFVLIDGMHSYDAVIKDFISVENKIKSGGVCAFHDFCEASQGTDRQWDGDYINVRKACKELGLLDNMRNGWTFEKEILGTRTTQHLEFGGNGMGIFKKK